MKQIIVDEFSRQVSLVLWDLEINAQGSVALAAGELLKALPDLTPVLGLPPRTAALRLVEVHIFGQ